MVSINCGHSTAGGPCASKHYDPRRGRGGGLNFRSKTFRYLRIISQFTCKRTPPRKEKALRAVRGRRCAGAVREGAEVEGWTLREDLRPPHRNLFSCRSFAEILLTDCKSVQILEISKRYCLTSSCLQKYASRVPRTDCPKFSCWCCSSTSALSKKCFSFRFASCLLGCDSADPSDRNLGRAHLGPASTRGGLRRVRTAKLVLIFKTDEKSWPV